MVVMGASPLFGPSGPSPVAHAQPSLSLAKKGIDPVSLDTRSAFQIATQQATRGGQRVAVVTPTTPPGQRAVSLASRATPTTITVPTDAGTPSAAAASSAAMVAASPQAVQSASGGGGGTDASAPGGSPVSAPGAQPSASTEHGLPWALPAAIVAGVVVLGLGAWFLFGRKKRKNPPRFARRRSGIGRNIKRLRRKGYSKSQSTAIALREAGIPKR